MQVEFEAKAFLSSKYSNIKPVMDGKELPSITMHGDYYIREGLPQIGTARVIITIDPQDKIVANQIEALRVQLQTVRAQHQREQNTIIDQISKLEALTFDGAAA